MKKLPLILAIMMLMIGCNRDNDSTIAIGGDRVLKISLEQTRTSLGSKNENGIYPVYWNEGDKIVANGTLSEEVEIDASNRACATIRFTSTSLSYPLHITYPHSASTATEMPIVEFSAEQYYAEGTFSSGCAPMCGYAENADDKITLKHLAAILHLPIKTASEGIILEKVVITSTSGAKLAGNFEVNCKDATILPTESCKSNISYYLPKNFALSTTIAKDLYIVLPAAEVGACKVEFVDNTGGKMTASWLPDAPLSQGIVREFKTITYRKGVSCELGTFGSYADDFIATFKKYADSNEIKIMSFNVRTLSSSDTNEKHWDNRKASCVELIKDQKPCIIGFQEAQFSSQWLYLKEQLANEYDGYGVNRDTGAESGSGEVMGILYNKKTIEKIEGGTFWLSETPDVPSKGFGASYSRNATWGIFKHTPSGITFFYINTHLDHKVAEAQIGGMKIIAKKFEEHKDTYPLFLTGDMNIKSDNVAFDAIEGFMYNARDVAPKPYTDYNTTYNAYQTNKESIIDHIYCSKGLNVIEYHTINEAYGTVPYVSDHYPIYAIIKLK